MRSGDYLHGQKIDPSLVNDDSAAWEVFEVGPDFKRSRLWISDNQYIMKTEYVASEALIKQNQDDLFESQNKRFGDGKVVARIPLNVFYCEIVPRQDDKDHLKWFLNNPDNKMYRSFRGRI